MIAYISFTIQNDKYEKTRIEREEKKTNNNNNKTTLTPRAHRKTYETHMKYTQKNGMKKNYLALIQQY